MEVLVIIVNRAKTRRRIKAYLKEKGMGDCIGISSVGTSSILEDYSRYKASRESTIDRMSTSVEEGETIFAINYDQEMSQVYMDEIAEIFGQKEKKYDSGIVFSIPITSFL